MDEHLYHLVSVSAGTVAGLMVVAGLALLLARRLTSPRVRRTTTRADKVLFTVLAVVILLGMSATVGKNLLGGGYDYRATIAVWFRGVLSFRPDPDLMTGVPLIFQLHAMSAWLLAAIWPFTRLVHVWSAPIAYLWRPYVVYRRRAVPAGGREMSAVRGAAAILLGAAGAAMVAAGPVMALKGARGRADIRAELRGQAISFPGQAISLSGQAPPAGAPGRDVLTGPQARAFAEVIGRNVLAATGGRTYAEVSAELMAAGGDDEALTRLRQTAFTGQMLRASLLNAYQAWQVTTLVIGLGALLTVTGAALLAASALLATTG
ncbi:hypothetical protein GCM10020220_033450 [Nonomuraea rubra]